MQHYRTLILLPNGSLLHIRKRISHLLLLQLGINKSGSWKLIKLSFSPQKRDPHLYPTDTECYKENSIYKVIHSNS